MVYTSTLLTRILIQIIRGYQLIVPKWIRNNCRYEPCCSDYSILAFNRYGLTKGIYKSILRILRCIPPFGGVDYP